MKDMEKTQTKPTVWQYPILIRNGRALKRNFDFGEKKERRINQISQGNKLKSNNKEHMYITYYGTKTRGVPFPKFGRLRRLFWVRKNQGWSRRTWNIFSIKTRREISAEEVVKGNHATTAKIEKTRTQVFYSITREPIKI